MRGLFSMPYKGLRLRERFALQLGGAAALVAIIVASTLTLYSQYTQNSFQTANLASTREALLQLPVDRLILTGKRLARSLAKPEIWENDALISERLSAARDVTRLIDIRIFTPDGRPMFVGARRADAEDTSQQDWYQPRLSPGKWSTQKIEKRIYAAGPIEFRGKVLGTLMFARSILPVEQEVDLLEAQLGALTRIRLSESKQIAWFIGSSLVVFALFTGILLARRMSAPILDLQSMTARVAGGDFQVKPETYRVDELGDLARSVSQMATQLDKTTVSRKFFSQIVEGMLDGLIVTNDAGKILMANRAACKMIGQPVTKLVNSPIQSFIGRANSDASSPTAKSNHVLKSVDGRQIPILVSASQVRLRKEKDISAIFVFRDITNIIEHREKLEAALVEAIAANKVRSEFLANMSHELHTPLNAIIGFSEILGGNGDARLSAEKRREYATDINLSGKHLLQVINQVLELSRIQTGDISIKTDEVNISQLIRALVNMTQPKTQEQGLEFIVEVNIDKTLTIDADEAKLKKTLNNILSNAVKFTPCPGTVTLRVGQSEGGLVITIEDTGIGMTPEELTQALEPFRQADNTHTRTYGGAGLGLTIARQYTELMGGNIDLQSTKDVGTTVSVYLPMGEPVEQMMAG